MTFAVLVAVGGGLGAGARWIISALLRPSGGFPLGITTVNVLGSFTLGMTVGSGLEIWIVDAEALAIGALGGFTTFSTWMIDIIEADDREVGALVTVLPLVLGVAAAWAGIVLGSTLG